MPSPDTDTDVAPLPVERWLQARDGTPLFCRDWLVPHGRGAVQIVHGLGEHGGRYQRLAQLLVTHGWSVRVCDQRGHGLSGGRRGSLPQPDDLLQDLKLGFDDLARHQQAAPVLFGHSMGGLVAARFATGAWSPVRALVLSSPALALDLAPWQQWLRALASRIAPGVALPTTLPDDRLSHDPEQVRAFRHDPLNHGKIAPRLLNFMLDAMHQAQRDAASFSRPVLLQVAGQDAFVAPRGARRFFDSLPDDARKTWCGYDQAYHEIFNEIAAIRDGVENDLLQWLERLPSLEE